jgi:hypothetical protein
MSLSKFVPKGLNLHECKHTKLRKPLSVPYIFEKEKVQEDVSKLCQLQIKTSHKKDTTLNLAVCKRVGTVRPFL